MTADIIDGKAFAGLNRERAEIEPVVLAYFKYKNFLQAYEESKALMQSEDAEMRGLAREEAEESLKAIEEIK